jgi:hypothetical protein
MNGSDDVSFDENSSSSSSDDDSSDDDVDVIVGKVPFVPRLFSGAAPAPMPRILDAQPWERSHNKGTTKFNSENQLTSFSARTETQGCRAKRA